MLLHANQARNYELVIDTNFGDSIPVCPGRWARRTECQQGGNAGGAFLRYSPFTLTHYDAARNAPLSTSIESGCRRRLAHHGTGIPKPMEQSTGRSAPICGVIAARIKAQKKAYENKGQQGIEGEEIGKQEAARRNQEAPKIFRRIAPVPTSPQ